MCMKALKQGTKTMAVIQSPVLVTEESQIREFLRKSTGKWRSERRYYTLPSIETQEGLSFVDVQWLEFGCPELLKLAEMHNLNPNEPVICGSMVSWHSVNSATGKPTSKGSTIFGLRKKLLYRDRGFAISTPVTATLTIPNPDTLCLKTEYNGSVFEEEIKHIGHDYRTRQTIVSRLGEQTMIGQYLERRIL